MVVAVGRPVTVYFVPPADCEGTSQPWPCRTTFARAAISRPRCFRPPSVVSCPVASIVLPSVFVQLAYYYIGYTSVNTHSPMPSHQHPRAELLDVKSYEVIHS
jgi:hypothetical protein